jgi:hypothetical protein
VTKADYYRELAAGKSCGELAMVCSTSDMAVCCSMSFGHPILRLRDGPFSVDTHVHAEQVLGVDGEGQYNGPRRSSR